VGEEFAFLAPLMVLLTVHLAVNLAVLPLFPINVAYNRVRVPGIVTFFMGIGNFGLAVALPLLAGLGYYGVAAAGAIVLTLKNAIFTPWYATRVLGVGAHTFTRSMLPGLSRPVSSGSRRQPWGGSSSFPPWLRLPLPVRALLSSTLRLSGCWV
jgi:hypothetical protein